MRACGEVYHSARLAEGYAFARPPVHERVADLIARRLGHRGAGHCTRALDIGCGAGRSTAPLAALAAVVVGIEPARAMLTHHAVVAPSAYFVTGRAEALPFVAGAFDLVTSAGALNYTDVPGALAEIARVLAPAGRLVIYDFSSGRQCRGGTDLGSWFAEFERRYPFPPGYALDVAALDYPRAGLRLDSFEPFEVAVPMTLDKYVAYVLSETNVERALARGVPESDVRAWCRARLAVLFARGPLDVLFHGYVACITHASQPPFTTGDQA